jgi:hypothetical protein
VCAVIANGVAKVCACAHARDAREGYRRRHSREVSSVYATQLSEGALIWLTDNSVINTEQRTNVAAILRCISDRLDAKSTTSSVSRARDMTYNANFIGQGS